MKFVERLMCMHTAHYTIHIWHADRSISIKVCRGNNIFRLYCVLFLLFIILLSSNIKMKNSNHHNEHEQQTVICSHLVKQIMIHQLSWSVGLSLQKIIFYLFGLAMTFILLTQKTDTLYDVCWPGPYMRVVCVKFFGNNQNATFVLRRTALDTLTTIFDTP